jgi:hypothetical protein
MPNTTELHCPYDGEPLQESADFDVTLRPAWICRSCGDEWHAEDLTPETEKTYPPLFSSPRRVPQNGDAGRPDPN